jgi:hypothetical protein
VPARLAAVQYEPFDVGRGWHVRGTLTVSATEAQLAQAYGPGVAHEKVVTGGGAFDVVLGAAESSWRDQPTAAAGAPTTPLAGTVGGAPFTPQTVIAEVARDGGDPYVQHLYLFVSPVDCGSYLRAYRSGAAVQLDEVGGASAKAPSLAEPQPALIWVHDKEGKDAYGGSGGGLVTWTALDLRPGGSVDATLAIHGWTAPIHLTGTVHAIACAAPP